MFPFTYDQGPSSDEQTSLNETSHTVEPDVPTAESPPLTFPILPCVGTGNYCNNLVYCDAREGGARIPFSDWGKPDVFRHALEKGTKGPLPFPEVTYEDEFLKSAPISLNNTRWSYIHSLPIPDELIVTLFQLGHGIIQKGDSGTECYHCQQPETVVHILGECLLFSSVRRKFFERWIIIAKSIKHDVQLECREVGNGSCQNLDAPLPSEVPVFENWLILPFIEWKAFMDINTETAQAFVGIFKYAASLLVCMHLEARDDAVLRGICWSEDTFLDRYNAKVAQYATDYVDIGSPMFDNIDLMVLPVV